MKYADLKDAARTCRDITACTAAEFTEKPIGDGWKVRCRHIVTFGNGSSFLYYLVDPKGISHGGYTSIQRFVAYAQGALED